MDNEFAQRFAMLRQGRGLTQQRLAEKLGVTAQAVSKYETGQSLPDVQTLKSLAAILGCTTDYLLGYELAKEDRVDMLERESDGQIQRALQKESITLCIGAGALVSMLMEENSNKYESIHKLRVRLAGEYGILVPVIRMMDQSWLADQEYEIRLFGQNVVGRGRLEYPMHFYLEEEAAEEGDIPASEPVHQIRGVWRMKPEKEVQKSETAAKPKEGTGAVQSAAAGTEPKKKPISCMEIITAHLEKVILENYGKILNRQLVAQMVEIVHRRYPAVTDGVVPERVSLARIQKTVAALIAERVPVNRMDYIISFLEEHMEDTEEDFATLKVELRG